MYGIDSGNGYVYGEDETATAAAGEHDGKSAELSMDNSAPSGALPDNL